MSATNGLSSLLWFLGVLAMIPLALWLLKRTPIGNAGTNGLRTIAALPLSTSQRIVTIEVGQGDDRRWLVLGVTPGSITTLHTMAPQAEVPAVPHPGFAQLLGRFQNPKGGGDGR